MREFPKPNFDDEKSDPCPLCRTKDIKPIYLIPIAYTGSGNTYEAIQVHKDCLEDNLFYYKEYNSFISTKN